MWSKFFLYLIKKLFMLEFFNLDDYSKDIADDCSKDIADDCSKDIADGIGKDIFNIYLQQSWFYNYCAKQIISYLQKRNRNKGEVKAIIIVYPLLLLSLF